MSSDRDRAAFEARAATYESGRLGRLHQDIADRTADLAVATVPSPQAVLDVGCGTGYLLRALADRYPGADRLDGIDPAPSMVAVAAASTGTGRLRFSTGVAEQLPLADRCVDLVVTTTSFDHWDDQLAGLRDCHRVLRSGGALVLVDQFSSWLTPTLLVSRRGKARTRSRCSRLLEDAGFAVPDWHPIYAGIIKAATASKP